VGLPPPNNAERLAGSRACMALSPARLRACRWLDAPRFFFLSMRVGSPGLMANVAPQDWCEPDSSEEELGPDIEYMESYGRVEQRRRRLARATSHGDGGAAA
jgi:hypothetical protein